MNHSTHVAPSSLREQYILPFIHVPLVLETDPALRYHPCPSLPFPSITIDRPIIIVMPYMILSEENIGSCRSQAKESQMTLTAYTMI